jgi:hypothetical protein
MVSQRHKCRSLPGFSSSSRLVKPYQVDVQCRDWVASPTPCIDKGEEYLQFDRFICCGLPWSAWKMGVGTFVRLSVALWSIASISLA